MKRFFVLLFATLLTATVSHAQNPTISMEGEVMEMTTDLDARAYFPKYDINDRLCALIKVTLIRPLESTLILEVGGLGVTAREEKDGGEVWFYVPAQVKNLSFKCAGYEPLAPIPVIFKEGGVYRITLNPYSTFETVSNAVLQTNYLKIGVNEEGATISIGKTTDYELLSQSFEGDLFATMLNLGEYLYKIEHPLYETYYGSVTLDATTPQQNIQLTPAYGYLTVTSAPSGASVYINNRHVGTTPCTFDHRLPKGEVELRIEQNDYHSNKSTVRIIGDGSRQTVHKTLKPRFANISLQCSDSEAEIWVDNKRVGKGKWSGRLGSISSHLVETRRAGHRSQSSNITVVDGVDATHTLKAPVPLYGSLNLSTSPMGCEIAIDGKVVGTTPYLAQLLVGSHEVTLSKDGYLKISFPVEIAHNETQNLTKNLEKGRLKAPLTVSCADSRAEIYVNNKFVGFNRWDGILEEGKCVVEARKVGCVTSRVERTISGSSKQYINIPAPREAHGTLTIHSKKGANVILHSKSISRTGYKTEELQGKTLPVGSYKAYASKEGYRTSSVVTFEIKEGEHANIDLSLESEYTPMQKLNRWCFDEGSHQYLSKFFAEATWSSGLIGANLGMFFGKGTGGCLGIHSSIEGGGGYGLTEFAVGPLFRLNLLDSFDVETQLYTGIGYNLPWQKMKYEAGLRFSYDLAETKIGCSSISLGGVYFNKSLYPKVGISFIPAAIIAQEQDTNVAWHLDMLFGSGQTCSCCGDVDYFGDTYNDYGDTTFMGAHIAYTPALIGWYGNILWKIEDEGASFATFTTGPTLSIYRNNLYLYGGVGLVDNSFGYDIGFTLAYMYDISIGYQWNDRHNIITFSFGFPFGGDDNGLGW